MRTRLSSLTAIATRQPRVHTHTRAAPRSGECVEALKIHRENGSILAGIHIEMTGQNVTECTGGAVGIFEEMLTQNYETYCDPRLNYGQSIEAAFQVAGALRP